MFWKKIGLSRVHFAMLVLIGLVVCSAYFGIWNFGFVYDDVQFGNPHLRTLTPISKFFTEPGVYIGNDENPRVWRPFGAFMRAVSWQFFGGHAGYYHSANLILHLLNITLIFFFISRFSGKRWLGLAIAAIVGVHPALTEAVTWASSQGTLIWTSLLLISCLLILSRRWLWLSYFTFALALLTKESALPGAIVLPALLWIVHFSQNRSFKAFLLRAMPYPLTALIYFIIHQLILPDLANIAWGTWLIMPYVVWQYVSLLLWPANLMILDTRYNHFPIPKSLFDPTALAGVLISLLLIISTAYFWKKKKTTEFFGLLWFGAFIGPFLQIIPTDSVIGTRALYVPLIGLATTLLVSGQNILSKLFGKFYRLTKTIAILGFILIITLISILSFIRNQDWKNSETLWLATLRANPENIQARVNLAYYYLGEGQNPRKALETSQELLKMYHNHFGGWLALADSYAALGDLGRAESEYLKLLRLYPSNHRVQRHLMFLYQSVGVNSGILVNTSPSKEDFYFEIHDVAVKDSVISWSEKANQEFKIFLPPGDYYIRFQGVDSERFTVRKDEWFPVTIKP